MPSVTACGCPVRRATLRRRLLSAPVARTQLRVRVLVGVVAVTLAALAAFDFTAVATMRHYLYGRALSELGAELEQTNQELSVVSLVPVAGRQKAVMSTFGDGLAGEFDIVWLPTNGKPVPIQLSLTSVEALGKTATPTVTR